MAQTILVIEDEPAILDLNRIQLERAGYQVITASTIAEAREHVLNPDISLILLDAMLPDGDGFDLCRNVRQERNVPIIMLTARTEDLDKILGLELGADDYVTKPFNPRELLARIRAILRRSEAVPPLKKELDRDVEIDHKTHRTKVRGENVYLTPKEYELLTLLAENPGEVFTRDALLDKIWGSGFYGDHKTVDVHIRRLREKVEEQPNRPKILLTVWGVGYRFREANGKGDAK